MRNLLTFLNSSSFRSPFDWKTPFGYLIIFAIEFSAFFLMAHFGVVCTGTLVASCYIVFILCNEIKNDINVLDDSSKAGETSTDVVKRVKNFIIFHAATKQLSQIDQYFSYQCIFSTVCFNFSETNQTSFHHIFNLLFQIHFPLFSRRVAFDLNNIFALNVISYFLWGLSTMCSSLLMAQMQLVEFYFYFYFILSQQYDFIFVLLQERNVSSFEFIKPLFLAYWSFSSLFLICEFGQMVTNHFDKLNDAVDECDYTLFPKEVQKVWPIVMLNIQQAFVLRTFESAACSRESFKRVNFLLENLKE